MLHKEGQNGIYSHFGFVAISTLFFTTPIAALMLVCFVVLIIKIVCAAFIHSRTSASACEKLQPLLVCVEVIHRQHQRILGDCISNFERKLSQMRIFNSTVG